MPIQEGNIYWYNYDGEYWPVVALDSVAAAENGIVSPEDGEAYQPIAFLGSGEGMPAHVGLLSEFSWDDEQKARTHNADILAALKATEALVPKYFSDEERRALRHERNEEKQRRREEKEAKKKAKLEKQSREAAKEAAKAEARKKSKAQKETDEAEENNFGVEDYFGVEDFFGLEDHDGEQVGYDDRLAYGRGILRHERNVEKQRMRDEKEARGMAMEAKIQKKKDLREGKRGRDVTQDPAVEAALSARAKISATTIAKLVKRTKRLGSTTRDVENYARFMSLKVAVQDWYAAELSPAPEVDKIWHAHLLDTRDYLETCQAMGVPQLCSGLIHHNPDGGNDVEARAKRQARAHQLYVKVFGEELQEAKEEDGSEDLDVDGMSEESLTSMDDDDEEEEEQESSVDEEIEEEEEETEEEDSDESSEDSAEDFDSWFYHRCGEETENGERKSWIRGVKARRNECPDCRSHGTPLCYPCYSAGY